MKYFTMEELDNIAKELIENPSRETLKRLNEKYNGDEINSNNLNWVEAQNNEKIQSQIISNNNPESSDNVIETNNNAVSDLRTPIYENQTNPSNESTNSEILNSTKNIEELEAKVPVWEPITENGNNNNTLFNSNINNQNTNSSAVEQSTNNNYSNFNINSVPNINVQEMPKNIEGLETKAPVWKPITENGNNTLFNSNINNQNNSLGNIELPKMDIKPNSNNIPSLELPKMESNAINNNQVPFSGNPWELKNNEINNMMQTTDNFNTPIEQTPNNEIPMEPNMFFQPTPSVVNNQIPVNEPPKVEGPTMFGQFEQNFNNNAA